MNYKHVDDLAAIWCEYGEMELRHENYDQALRILRVRLKKRHVSACQCFFWSGIRDETYNNFLYQ